jgi:AsmA-like C-terminal region
VRKVFRNVGVGLLLLVVVVAIGVFLYRDTLRDELVARVTAEAERHVDADIGFGQVDLTLVRTFPDVELHLTGVTVVGKGEFAGIELARLGTMIVSMDLVGAVRGELIEVHNLDLRDGALNVLVNAQGRMNTDLAIAGDPAAPPPADPAEESAFSLNLKRFAFANLDLSYDDQQGGTRVQIKDLDGQGAVSVVGDASHVSTKATVAGLTVHDGGVDLLRSVAVDAEVDLDVDGKTGAIRLGKNTLGLNALTLSFEGGIAPEGDDLGLDLRFAASETSFKSLLSLIPAVYSEDFAGLVSSGSLSLNGEVKGTYKADAADHLPAFDLSLEVKDGSFKYPDLPTSVDAVALAMVVKHPEGPADLVEVDVSRFAFAVGGGHLQGALKLRHPVSDPDVETRVVGQVDLGALRGALPDDGTKWQGKLDMDLDIAGRVSDFEAQVVDRVRAQGFFRLAGFLYEDPSLPHPVLIESLEMTLDPRHADVGDLRMLIGPSDIRLVGQIDNFVDYTFGDATLEGRLNLTSTFLDLDSLASEPAAPAGAPPPPEDADGVIVVPSNLDVALDLRIDKVRTEGRDLTDLTGKMVMKDGAVAIESLQFGFIGGRVGMSGRYAAPTAAFADVDLSIEMVDFNVGDTVAAFETLQVLAPVAKGANGKFNSKMEMQARLKQDGAPDLLSLQSNGRLLTSGMAVQPTFLAAVADKLENPKIAALDLSDAELFFDIKNGRVQLTPMATRVGGVAATLGGSTGTLDQTLDLEMKLELPVGDIGAADLLSNLGVSKDGLVDVVVKVGGTFDKPSVKVDVGSLVDSLKDAALAALDDVKGQALAAADDVAQKLLADARTKGDALVAEAEKAAALVRSEAATAADRLRAEAKKAGDKLVSDAGSNALMAAAAKEAKKKLVEEADKKAKKLESEADKKATALVSTASTQRDKLISEAEARSKLK